MSERQQSLLAPPERELARLRVSALAGVLAGFFKAEHGRDPGKAELAEIEALAHAALSELYDLGDTAA